MGEALLAYAPAILAVAIVVILRLYRIHKEASKKIAALQKELTVLQDGNRDLEHDLKQAQRQAPNRLASPSLREYPRYLRARSRLAGHPQIEEALDRLEAIKTALSLDSTVEEKYMAELDKIIESLDQATGMDLSRWLGIPPSEAQQSSTFSGRGPQGSEKGVRQYHRDLFRFKILSLQAFCNYQIHHSQRSSDFPGPLPRDTRVH